MSSGAIALHRSVAARHASRRRCPGLGNNLCLFCRLLGRILFFVAVENFGIATGATSCRLRDKCSASAAVVRSSQARDGN